MEIYEIMKSHGNNAPPKLIILDPSTIAIKLFLNLIIYHKPPECHGKVRKLIDQKVWESKVQISG